MFPFFKGTVFENGIDAAFRSTTDKEAYLFKGDKYARIDYGTNSLVQSIENISDGFTCFHGTVFENGLDAAFSSHKINEAYKMNTTHVSYLFQAQQTCMMKNNMEVSRMVKNNMEDSRILGNNKEATRYY
ncbi:putative Hemopexin-like domain-containing protein [Medicago truncatula]|nr:putative Hemopexin-like domain-containing protein [Medicago truncatula]